MVEENSGIFKLDAEETVLKETLYGLRIKPFTRVSNNELVRLQFTTCLKEGNELSWYYVFDQDFYV